MNLAKSNSKMAIAIRAQLANVRDGQMLVVCTSVGNPDHGQYAPLSEPELYIVDNYEAASGACMGYIEAWNLGGGNWSGGQVYTGAGFHLLNVSYNGRVWRAAKCFVNSAEIEVDTAARDKYTEYYAEQIAVRNCQAVKGTQLEVEMRELGIWKEATV